MKTKLFVILSIALVTAILMFAGEDNKIPKGWFAAGSNPSEYEMGIDSTTFQNGQFSVYLKSKNPKSNEFGTLMQSISAENYLGKRIMLSGYIKSENIEGWGAIWMRIDGKDENQLGFDNMYNRAVKGTNDWKKYEIVLDVPSNSKSINYGILLGGFGKIWADNLNLKLVDESVPVTNLMRNNKLPAEPNNLDFEE